MAEEGRLLVAGGTETRSAGPRHICTYVGVSYDQSDFDRLNVGNAGYWFPQFDAQAPVSGRPTGERAVDELPSWTTPFNHTTHPLDPGCGAAVATGCIPTYLFRTFSQDGPARSAGGRAGWDTFTLPDGTTSTGSFPATT